MGSFVGFNLLSLRQVAFYTQQGVNVPFMKSMSEEGNPWFSAGWALGLLSVLLKLGCFVNFFFVIDFWSLQGLGVVLFLEGRVCVWVCVWFGCGFLCGN